MIDKSPSQSELPIFAPLHRQRKALSQILDQRLREILNETVNAITATVAANFWLLVAQRLVPAAQNAGSMPVHLSENFGSHNIYASGLTLSAVIDSAQKPETADHLRNQIVVGLCCALENAIAQMADHLRTSAVSQSGFLASEPVRKWAGIRSFYFGLNGPYSHGFHDDCLLRLQKLFWARNRIVHHDAKWSNVLDGYPSFWEKADRVRTRQNSIDAIVQWIDNELLHSWHDLDAVWVSSSLPGNTP